MATVIRGPFPGWNQPAKIDFSSIIEDYSHWPLRCAAARKRCRFIRVSRPNRFPIGPIRPITPNKPDIEFRLGFIVFIDSRDPKRLWHEGIVAREPRLFASARPMTGILNFAWQFVATVLAADLVAGFVHWLEDTYGREDTPIWGSLVTRHNIIHHHMPRYFVTKSWLQSSWGLFLLATLVVLGAWGFGVLTWHVWLFAILGANANQIHKWAHQTPSENGRLIGLLQRCRLIQSPEHHARHHTDPKASHYCVITEFLNPILDGARVWDGLEWLVWRLTGVRRRSDTSLPANGPAPEWIANLRAKH